MARVWYEVRIRENLTKKSKFYFTQGPSEAGAKYKGSGHIMWVQKVGKEKLLGIGEFFTLGDRLLKELRQGGDLLAKLEVESELRRNQNKQRGYYGRERKKATNQYK